MSKPELSRPVEQYLKHGLLLDSVGFSGDRPDFDSLEFFRLANVLFTDQDIDVAESEVYGDVLQDERFEMRRQFYNDDEIASFTLGIFTGIATLHPDRALPITTSMKLIERAVEGIRLTRLTYGYGDERLFEGGYIKGHQILAQMYGMKTSRILPEHMEALVRNRKKTEKRRSIGQLSLAYQYEQRMRSANPHSFIVERILRDAEEEASSEGLQGRDDAL